MDGVAAKVAEEVDVLFEHGDMDARSRKQEAEHDSRGAAADDAACGLRGWRCGSRHCTSLETSMNIDVLWLDQDSWRVV